MAKTNVQVYDWPVRIFHWVFAGLFIAAFFIAKVFDDDSTQYPYHMMLGFTLAIAVLLRILWGIFGTRYARFTSFELNLRELLSYMKSLVSSPGKIFTGHNPASSWAAVVMMLCALGLAASGYLMVTTDKEDWEDIHELFANAFVITAIAHVAGVIYHTIRHKDPVGLSMIHGKKKLAETEAAHGIQKNFLIVGIVFVLLTGGFGLHLFRNYNSETMVLTLLDKTYQLGKVEKTEQGEQSEQDEHDD